MPIDVVQWRVRIGLFHSEGAYREMKRRCGCKHQKIKIRSLVGDASFVVAVALLAIELIRAMVLHSITVLRGLQWKDVTECFHTTMNSLYSQWQQRDDKPSVSRKSTCRSTPRLITDLPALTAVCIVVLHSVVRMLLLMSGDVERNPGPQIILSVEDLSTFTNILGDAAPKWNAIGDQLGFKYDEMKSFQSIPQCATGGDQVCFRELLAQWLKWAPPKHELPTLEELVSAVREAGEERLAYDLPQKYMDKKAVKDSPLQSPTHSTDEESLQRSHRASPTGNERSQSQDDITDEELSLTHLDTSGLTHEQAEALKGRLIEESKGIMLQFQNLVTALKRSLEAQKVSIKDLAFHLCTLGAFSSVKPHKPVLDECLDEIKAAPDMIEVFWILRNYFSFFNYHIIEHIITEFGTDQTRALLKKYREDFQKYCKRRLTENPLRFGRTSSVKMKVTITLDAKFQHYRIEELQTFRHRLADILKVSEVTLHLCYADSSKSINLVFQVPTFVTEKTFPLTSEQQSALVAEGVLELVCGDYRWTKEGWKVNPLSHSPTLLASSDKKTQSEITVSNTVEEAVPTSILATPLSTLPSPLPRIQQRNAHHLEEEIHELKTLFLDVVDKAASSLEKAPVDLKRLKRYIVQLPVSVRLHHVKFFAGNLSAINKSKTVREVFRLLALYWDCMNYHLLEVIVNQFGDEGTKSDVEKYLQRLKDFRSRTKVREYIAEKWIHGWPPHFANLTIEVKEEWMERTLEDLEEFRLEIAHKCSFESYTLLLKEVEVANLRLCFALQHSFPVRAMILQDLKELSNNESVHTILFQGITIKELSQLGDTNEGNHPCKTQGSSTVVKETDQPEDTDVQQLGNSEEKVQGVPEASSTGGSKEDVTITARLLATESLLKMERNAKEELQQQLVESKWRAKQAEMRLEETDLFNKQVCSERDLKSKEFTAALEQKEAQMNWERKRVEELQLELEKVRKGNAEKADLLNKQLHSERNELTAALEQREAQMNWERKRVEELQLELEKVQKETTENDLQLCSERKELTAALEQREAQMNWERKRVEELQLELEKVRKENTENDLQLRSERNELTAALEQRAAQMNWERKRAEELQLELEKVRKENTENDLQLRSELTAALEQREAQMNWERKRAEELQLELEKVRKENTENDLQLRSELTAALEQREAQMNWERKRVEELQLELEKVRKENTENDLQLRSERNELTAALEQREAQMNWERKRVEELQLELEKVRKENAGQLEALTLEAKLKLEKADLFNKQLCSERDKLTAALGQREAQMDLERKSDSSGKEIAALREQVWEQEKELQTTGLEQELKKLKPPTQTIGDSLIKAAREGNERTVVKLLCDGADPNYQEETYGNTALTWASSNGNHKVVELLLNAGADANMQKKDGCSALLLAAQEGHETTVKVLLDAQANPNLPEETNGDTPLIKGAMKGHDKVVQALLSVGADPNYQRKDSDTALTVAAFCGHHSVVELLLKYKADVNLQRKDGCSALLLAAQEGHETTVKVLLDAQANPNLPEETNGDTPLIKGAMKGHDKVVQALLSVGADPNYQRKDGMSPLMFAANKGHDDIVQLLLEAGADLNLQDKDGDSALTCALYQDRVKIAELLLQKGADQNLQTNKGETAIDIARRRGHTELCQLMLQSKR